VEPSSTSGAHGDRASANGIGVFVCYRREDTAGFARALKTVLDERYGEDRVFMDLDSIAPGQRWEDVINEAVGSCHAFLALIGPEWLTVKDAEGRLRLWKPDDPVRLEIEAAVRENLLLLPVLLEGARVPAKEDLPDGLAALPETQALTITDDWDSGVAKLVKALDAVVRGSTDVGPIIAPKPADVEEPVDHESRPNRAGGRADETALNPSGAVEPERPRRTLRTVLVAGLVALAAIAGGIAIAASRHGPDPVHDYLWNAYNLVQRSANDQRTAFADAIKHKDVQALKGLQQRRSDLLATVQTWVVPPEAKATNDALAEAFHQSVLLDDYWIAYASGTGTKSAALAYQNSTMRPAKYAFDKSYNELRNGVSHAPPELEPNFLF
jgi:hypothetical protein